MRHALRLPTSCPVSQQPSRKPVMGLIEQISSGSPSTLRAVRRRPSPPDLAFLSIAVLQRSFFLGITRLGPGFRINCLVYDN